jgi:hypothetical protein
LRNGEYGHERIWQVNQLPERNAGLAGHRLAEQKSLRNQIGQLPGKKDADLTLKIFDDLFKEKSVLASNIAPFLINTPYPGVEKYTNYASAHLGLFPLKNVKALMPEFGPVINDVTSFQYPITISSCGNPPKPDVFIAVISAPENFKQRTKIRQSWKNQINLVLKKGLLGRIHFAFVLGRAETNLTQQRIEEENTSNNDIIQIEMLDFYRNLPLKMARLLNWVHNNCPQIDFVLKVDEDMYVNLYVLAHFVKSYNESAKWLFSVKAFVTVV